MNEYFDIVFNSIAEGIVITNPTGNIVFANNRMRSLFGYQSEELIGQNVEVLIPNSRRNNHRNHMQGYFQTPKVRPMGKDYELTGLRKDGSEFPLEISLNYLESENEMLALALITDISQRKQAQDKIEELNRSLELKVKERTMQLDASIKLYHAIARNFPDGTINVLDQDLHYVFVDGKELSRQGVTSKRLVGSSYLDRISKDEREEVKQFLHSIFDGNADSREIALGESYYQLDGVPLLSRNGEKDRILLVEKNITAKKRVEKEMEKSLRKEKELSSLKSRFVSMASHEFRTPLSAILSSVNLLEKYVNNPNTEKQEKHLNRIKNSVNDLTEILNDFLSLDKLEEGLIQPKLTETNIPVFLENIIEETKAMLKRGQQLNYTHTGDNNWMIDVNFMKNIYLNLVSNASKYSKEEKSIFISTNIEKDHFEFRVRDEGIGIPKEEQHHLFDRFFRAKNATNYAGTGLGLNIVRKYVQLMDGKISFESNEAEGSTFRIQFLRKPNE